MTPRAKLQNPRSHFAVAAGYPYRWRQPDGPMNQRSRASDRGAGGAAAVARTPSVPGIEAARSWCSAHSVCPAGAKHPGPSRDRHPEQHACRPDANPLQSRDPCRIDPAATEPGPRIEPQRPASRLIGAPGFTATGRQSGPRAGVRLSTRPGDDAGAAVPYWRNAQ